MRNAVVKGVVQSPTQKYVNVSRRFGFNERMQTLAYPSRNALVAPPANIMGMLLPKRLTASMPALIASCAIITAILGYVDYVTGYEQTFLLFYLVPIGLGTWFGAFWVGLVFSILSIVAWIVSDVAAGVPTVGAWKVIFAFGAFCAFPRFSLHSPH